MLTVISSNEYTPRNRGETIRDLAGGINQEGMGNFQSTLPFTNIGLSGRATQIVFLGVSGLVSYGIGMIFVKEVFSGEVQNQVFEISLFLGSITIVGATILAFVKAHRRRFLTHKVQCAAGVFWIVISVLGIAIRPTGLPIVAYPMILAFSAVVILPVAATPLAIAWNRHR